VALGRRPTTIGPVFEIGTSLREARLRQSLELPEIEQATKVRARYLRALEEEQFDSLPAPTYVKGFLRTYADYLGMDGQLYVDEYNSRYIIGEDEPPLRRSAAAPRYGRRLESRVLLLALAAIGVATALVIAAWKFGGAHQETLPPTVSQHHPTGSTTKPGKRRSHGAPPATLILTASAPTYVKVRLRSNVGKQVYAGTMDPGQSNRFYSKRLWIAASDPQSLRASLNGKVVALPSTVKRTGVVVTSAGLKGGSTGA
jgi:cytoskeleton protein RodZ